MLRPLPDLDDAQAMTKLGRLSAIRSARLDAIHELRDIVVRIQSLQANEEEEIKAARLVLDRLAEIGGIEKHI